MSGGGAHRTAGDSKERPAARPGVDDIDQEGPVLALLKAEYFRRFDLDLDGLLTLNEYPFIIDTTIVPQAVLLEVNFKAPVTD